MIDAITTYTTHDNGGRPFKVVIDNNTSFPKITVFENDYEDEDEDENIDNTTILTNKEILSIMHPNQIFIGKSPKCEMTIFSGGVGKEFDGNAILIRPDETLDYIFVGSTIEKFKADSEILHFVSPVGNNDVPYTYAITANKIYLLLENIIISTFEMDHKLLDKFIKGSLEPYTFHYGHETIKTFPKESEILETEVIHKRIW